MMSRRRQTLVSLIPGDWRVAALAARPLDHFSRQMQACVGPLIGDRLLFDDRPSRLGP